MSQLALDRLKDRFGDAILSTHNKLGDDTAVVERGRILEICRPYLGEVVGVYSDWTPLQDRSRLFPEDLDPTDPWQFKNFRVT